MLALAIVLVLILFIAGGALLKVASSARMLAVRTTAEIAARTAADAGLTRAVYLMNQKLRAEEYWENSTLPAATHVPLPNSNESYSFTITGDAINGFMVRSTGRSGQITRTVNAQLGPGSMWFGVGVNQYVDVKVGVQFFTIPADSPFTILTNETAPGSILFKSGVIVPGDVAVGPGGDPEIVIVPKEETSILGETYAIAEEFEFPPVIPPSGLPYRGSIIASETVNADGQCDTINLPNTAELRIEGDVTIYVTGDVILNYDSLIHVTPGASLKLYVGGIIEAKTSSGFIDDNITATSLKIFGTPTCTAINLKAKTDFYGAIYAPSADIQLFNDADLYGAVVGKSFEMKNSGNFYYVAELGKADLNDDTAYFEIRRWWE